MSKHRQSLGDAIHGRRQAVVAIELERTGQAAEGTDIERAAQGATDAVARVWPNTSSKEN